MISRLLVENFKSLRVLDLELGRFALVVGPTGCGKSSLLQAAALTCELSQMRVPELSASYLSKSASGGIMLRAENDRASRSWVAEPGAIPECIGTGDEAGLRALDAVARYRLSYECLARPARSAQLRPQLGPRGELLAEVLDALWSEEPQRFDALERLMLEMTPGLRRVRSARCEARIGGEPSTTLARVAAFDYEHAPGLAASEVSEGAVVLLGVLTAIASARGPMTLLFDDLDRALDPHGAMQLVAHLRRVVDERPELQLIVTSSSPTVAGALGYEEVLVMGRSTADGASHVASLAAHPEAAAACRQMSAGDFVGRVGYDWVLGSRA